MLYNMNMGTKPQRSARRLSKHAVAEPMEPNAPAPKAGERILSTAEARSHLSETLGRVAYAGERVLIGKRGRPMAALVPVADLEALRAMEDAIDLQAARQSVREGGENLSHAAVGKRLGLR